MFIAALVVSDALCFSASYSKLLYLQELNNNIISAEALRAMSSATPNLQNTTNFTSWFSEFKSAAAIDGFSVNVINGTILAESNSYPKVYATIELND